MADTARLGDREALTAMMDAIGHRGRTARNLFDGPVGLGKADGHHRPKLGRALPMRTISVVVFNGEYTTMSNFGRALRVKSVRTQSDTRLSSTVESWGNDAWSD